MTLNSINQFKQIMIKEIFLTKMHIKIKMINTIKIHRIIITIIKITNFQINSKIIMFLIRTIKTKM